MRRLVVLAALSIECRSEQGILREDGSPGGDAPLGAESPRPGQVVVPCDPTEEWCPGEDIPGWPSKVPDLSDLDGKPVVEYEMPAQEARGRFGGNCDVGSGLDMRPCATVSQPSTFMIRLGDCDDHTCYRDEEVGKPWWDISLVPNQFPAPDSPLGWWKTLDEGVGGAEPIVWFRQLNASLRMHDDEYLDAPQNWGGDPEAFTTLAPGRAFLSEVRPDRVRGLIYFDLTDVPGWVYEPVVFLTRFDIAFPDHAGYQGSEPPGSGESDAAADEVWWFHYQYLDRTYDEAWPWDSITDPVVRAQVYERYTPYLTD